MLNPSFSQEAEQSVLQVLLTTDGGELVESLSRMLVPEHFYYPAHASIWKSILSLQANNLSADPVSVCDNDSSIDLSYVVDLCGTYASSANAKHYAMIIKERYEMRQIISALSDSMAMVHEPCSDWKKRKGEIAGKIDAVFHARENGTKGLQHASGIAKSWLSNVVDIQQGNHTPGFTTGIPELNEILAPKLLVPGSLVGIGARPKMGKSALMAKITSHFGITLNMPSLVFSMEMGDEEVIERGVTGDAQMSPATFYQPMTDGQYFDLQEATKGMINSKIYVDDTPGVTIEHIKSESRKVSRKEQVGIICVDYLTLMEAPKADRNDLAYGKITKDLKNLARELNCIVVLLLQLNRSLESRPNIMDRKPAPSDSRDTGQIEQDVDIWIGLFKAGAYEKLPNPGLTELIVRLNRKGGTGSCYLDMKQGYFDSLSNSIGAMQDHENIEALSAAKQTVKKRGFEG